MFRLLLPVVAVLMLAMFQTSHCAAQGKLGPKVAAPIKWEIGDFSKTFEKEFPLKIKSWELVKEAVTFDKKISSNHIRVVLEFTKDVDANAWNAPTSVPVMTKEETLARYPINGPFRYTPPDEFGPVYDDTPRGKDNQRIAADIFAARGFPLGWGSVDPYVEFFHFDDENVRIAAARSDALVDGDRTGKKGDAFRLYLPTGDDELLAKTKRVEVYLRNPKKKAEKTVDGK